MSETRRTEYEMNKWMEYVIAAMQRLCAFDMTWCDRWHFFFVYARQFGSELLMILCCCVKIICVCAHRPSPSSQYTAHRNGNVLNVHLMFARHSNRNEIKSQWKKKLYIKLLNNFIRLASEWARARETMRAPVQWHGYVESIGIPYKKRQTIVTRIIAKCNDWTSVDGADDGDACRSLHFLHSTWDAIIAMIFFVFFLFWIQICFLRTKKLWDRYGCLTFMMLHLFLASNRCVFSHGERSCFCSCVA